MLYRNIHKDSAGVTSSCDNTRTDYRGLSLAWLFTLAGPDWKGGTGGMAAPRTWNRLMEVYQMNGMPIPDKWLLCTREKGIGHSPAVFRSSNEFTVCPIENCGMKKSDICAFS